MSDNGTTSGYEGRGHRSVCAEDSVNGKCEPQPDSTQKIDREKRLADYVVANRAPLIDGNGVEIDQTLIDQVEAACEVRLPKYPPDDEIIEPDADHLGNEDLTGHVEDKLLAEPIIGASLRAAGLLKESCVCRQEQLSRPLKRLVKLQELTDLQVPVGKSGKDFDRKRYSFWRNWSWVGMVLCLFGLVFTVLTENVYQVTAFMNGDWGLTQSPFGAFGFTWAFTLGVVVITWSRRTLRKSGNDDEIVRVIARRGMRLAWWGLAGLGLMIGMLHAGEEGDGRMIQLFRCVQIVAQVLVLAVMAIGFEWGCEHFFKRAYRWTLVANEELDTLDAEINVPSTKLMIIEQLTQLATGVENRIESHIKAESRAWLSRRDSFRKQNNQARELRKAEETVKAAEQATERARLHLAALQDSGAA